MVTAEQIREIMVKELPDILENTPEIHQFFVNLSRRHFADKTRTDDRFDRLLDEMRQEREEQKQKWDDLQVSQRQEREEQKKKWAANQQVITEMLTDIRALSRKHDTTIGSLGARWGLHTEQSFRNALKGHSGRVCRCAGSECH